MTERSEADERKEMVTRIGHDGLAWPETMDGRVWAEEFSERFPTVPIDDSLGWFCNAIMRGFDTANQRRDTEVRQFIGWLSGDIPELHSVDVPVLADSWDRFRSVEVSDAHA